jgi:transcriptional regulator with XRE-family HTH domain
MNSNLANNVRTLREVKNWTQQHLADAAGILLRTVQRVEGGQGGSTESPSPSRWRGRAKDSVTPSATHER